MLNDDKFVSHPSRVRELKLITQEKVVVDKESHPSRVRELKLRETSAGGQPNPVAPLPGA